MQKLISLPEHCYRVSCLLSDLPEPDQQNRADGNPFVWSQAADWINIASGIERVSLSTARFDESVMLCDGAWEYESKRTEILTHLVTNLVVFNFVWGGLETVVKVIAPKGFDYEKGKKMGRRGDIPDRGVFYLKNEYDPLPRLPLYDETLARLISLLNRYPESYYSSLNSLFRVDPLTSISGLGLHVVDKIRNDFAHGSARLPDPELWGEEETGLSKQERVDSDLIDTSSRLLLLTLQMMLLACFKRQFVQVFTPGYLYDWDDDEPDDDIDARIVMQSLHLDMSGVSGDQLRLFAY